MSTNKERNAKKKKKTTALKNERNVSLMNVEKKVSLSEYVESFEKQNTVNITIESVNNVEIQIKRVLSWYESLAFIEGVVDSCIDYENGDYLPEAYDLAIKSALLEFYTNVDVPEDATSQYELVYFTDIVERVLSEINAAQFNDNIRAVDKKIAFYTNLICSSVSAKVDTVVQKVDEFAESASKLFSGVDPDKMASVVEQLSAYDTNNPATQESIARTILNIYKEDTPEVTLV